MEKGCSMKGFLEFQILTMINKKDLSGQQVRLEIGKRKGCIPSPGTVYPVIKGLLTKNLIKEIKINSKEKKYKITQGGKLEVKRNKKIFMGLFQELFS